MHCLLRGMVAELERRSELPAISVEPLPRNGSRTMPLVMVEFRIGYWQKLRIITCVKETQKSD